MITKEQLQNLISEKTEGTDSFIVELAVRPGNKIEVIMDADSGMTIEKCTEIHRHIASLFDKDVDDFEIMVSSPGVGEPLMIKRQYSKNIGRTISIKDLEGNKNEGTLTNTDDNGITILAKIKEEVPGKKGKKLVEKELSFAFDQIKEAKIVISFK